jgi:predicted membrane channel-forming protein YqfA (hemolysin III family)
MADEGDGSRLDRELIELLNELRVVLPGVQVLFAFLLTVPFTSRFEEVTTAQRTTYFVAFAATALSSVLLIGPSAHHRLQWRQHDKEALLRRANWLAIGGLILLSVAISSVTFLIADVVYDERAAAIGTAALAATTAAVWFVMPLVRRATRE